MHLEPDPNPQAGPPTRTPHPTGPHHPPPFPSPQISWSSRDFSLESHRPVVGRTIVVHSYTTLRAACGIITPTADQFTTVGTYPGLAANTVQGHAAR